MTIISPLFIKVYICCNSLVSHCCSMLHRLFYFMCIFYGTHSRWRRFHTSTQIRKCLTIFSNMTAIHDILATFSHSLRFTALLLLDMAALILVV